MKILVLSFYFRPDLCAGSFRATALVNELRRALSSDSHIDVITTLPNRYHSFSSDAPRIEQQDGITITRIAVPQHQSGMLDQSKTFLSFFRGVVKAVANQNYDIVFATSSRLMTAVLGAWIARRMKTRLYLDIRDIFVDTIREVLPRKAAWAVAPFFSQLEKWAVTRADRVNLVSRGFSDYFGSRYPHHGYSFFTNGIDDEFLSMASVPAPGPCAVTKERALTVLYAGNLGEGQGLHKIIPQLAQKMGSRIFFRIIGDGGRRDALEKSLTESNIANVRLSSPVMRSELLAAYHAADVLFLHLNDYNAFKKVLPSKIFEYAAMGKPIWAGVSGYAAEFIRSEVSNATVFHPCDAEQAVLAFEKLIIRDILRPDFVEKYSRATISKQMAEDILEVTSRAC